MRRRKFMVEKLYGKYEDPWWDNEGEYNDLDIAKREVDDQVRIGRYARVISTESGKVVYDPDE